LIEKAPGTQFNVVPLGRPELDLAGDVDQIARLIEAASPQVLVSAAAYTQVDRAESERELAFAINERGPGAIARAAHRLGVPLIHLSTDYVFDGSKSSPYVEEDPTRPTGVYGASKLAGERAVLANHDNCAVLRTAWVYSPFGTNFVKTMLRIAAERDEIRVVGDQRGNPSSALDIAAGILSIAANLLANNDPSRRGIFHMAGTGDASWAEFAEAIFAASARAGGPTVVIRPIASSEYPTAAKRPANSRLDSTKLEMAHGVRLPDWHQSVKEVVERLVQTGCMRSVDE
jgi:dTDP-4-dehydrorhamnose reductase